MKMLPQQQVRLAELARRVREDADRANATREARDMFITELVDELRIPQIEVAQVAGLSRSLIVKIVGNAPVLGRA